MNKAELEELFEEISRKSVDSALKESDKVSNKIVRSINGMNQDILDRLEEVAEDGKVPLNRVNSADTTIRATERDYLVEIEDAIISSIEQMSSEVVDEFVKESSKVPELGAILTATLIAALKKEVVRDISDRELSGATLKDRIRALTMVLSSEVMKSVKYGILLKESVAKTFRRVSDTIKANLWQIKRILSSELLTTVRMATMLFGEKAGILKGIRIIDNRGRHGGHHLHKCYIYAEEDKYGMGKGVYKLKDRYILDPHPQCTAYFEYVLNDKLFGKGAE